jgi:hypothetical protein
MGKMILLMCLIAGSGSKPDIVSVDFISLQGGLCPLVALDYFGLAGWAVGSSFGRIRAYWQYGQPHSAFCLGFEAFSGNIIYSGWSGTSEALTPQIGFAILGTPKDHWLLSNYHFVPRLELVSGISFLFPLNLDAGVVTVKTELAWKFLPPLTLRLEHRYFMEPWSIHVLTAMLYLTLGLDKVKSNTIDSTKLYFLTPPPPDSARKYKAYLYESNIVQASGGVDVCSGEILLPALSISLMDLRVYPERNVPLFTGIEGARLYWGNTMDSTPSIKMLSLVSPRVGLVILMKPRSSMRSKWTGLFEGERFVPRLEFSAGTSLINLENLGGSNWQPFSGSLGMFAVIRTEIRWKFSAMMSMHAEHRWFMPSRFSANFDHSFGLSLNVGLGKDNIRTNKKD